MLKVDVTFKHFLQIIFFNTTFELSGMFNTSNDFFIKPLELQRDERIDFTMVPSNNQAFEEYVKNHLTKKDLRVPYLLNEFVKGEEFAANVACRDGSIFMIQVHKNLDTENGFFAL